MREERGRRGGFDDSKLREKVEFLGPEVSLDLLRNAVSTAIVDRLGATWDERYGQLKSYKDEHSDCAVPADGGQLWGWVSRQRQAKRSGWLSTERTARLDEIGFIWNTDDAAWKITFNELKQYKVKHGHCDVSRLENSSLGSWVTTQRYALSKGRMSTERKALLDGIGFDWDPVESRWESMFIELTHFKNKHGHCNVSEKENVELAGWVMRQRDAKVRRKLSTDRKARLDEIGFVWDPARELAWETMFSALKNYIEKFGDPNVPDKWSESLKLASWVGTQRMHKRKNRLSADREARLDGIGFSWNPTILRGRQDSRISCFTKANTATAMS